MQILTGITKLSPDEMGFVSSYISHVLHFREAVDIFISNRQSRYITIIQNTDLWIDVWISKYPALQEFRDEVLGKMKELRIEPYLPSTYELANHYRNER